MRRKISLLPFSFFCCKFLLQNADYIIRTVAHPWENFTSCSTIWIEHLIYFRFKKSMVAIICYVVRSKQRYLCSCISKDTKFRRNYKKKIFFYVLILIDINNQTRLRTKLNFSLIEVHISARNCYNHYRIANSNAFPLLHSHHIISIN